MKIKDYKCKCGCNDFFFADKGNQKGIYCTKCGKWLKWADKDEKNLVHCLYTDEEIAKSFIEDVEAVKDQLPCGQMMEFPKTFDEFVKDYGFKDKQEVYTNGVELIPVYRVKQWLEHIKSSSTKNDLEVREFEEIVVEYPPEDLCTYPEYKGKPYFSIKYKKGNDCFIGYGTYNPKVFSRYLRDYFMPPVTPQEPRWIPMVRREPTDEEKADYLAQNGEELCYMLENEMPLNGQEVLVSIGEFVAEDVFDEDFYNFENNDIENVDAWMPKPKPYKKSEEV